jgi:pantothenate kinase-related protein Tda10
LDELLREAAVRSAAAVPSDSSDLFQATRRTPLHAALFPAADQSILEERLEAWRRCFASEEENNGIPAFLRPFTAWSYPFALAQWIRSLSGNVFGFAGPPGSGKTTLVSVASTCLRALDPGIRAAQVSLDDFYLSRQERLARGFFWRALPGTHHIDAAVDLLSAVAAKKSTITIPRFDPSLDEPKPAERIAGPLSILLLEGWFVGKRDGGYERLSRLLDHLIYLDCPLPLAKRRRLARERALRAAGGGMSPEEMRRFWTQVLEPGIELWVKPVRQHADLILGFNSDGEITAAHLRAPGPASGLAERTRA